MYLTLKLLHVVAVVLFLGNIATGLFWKAHADRTGDPRLIAHTLEGVIRSDRLFTLPGVALIVLFGFAAAFAGGLPVLRTGWIFWSIVLFTVSGAAFMARVAPLQRQMLAVARAAHGAEAFDWARYRDLSRRWELWGAIALVTPVAAMALMVLKPAW
ncbi:MAG TPA: DUF2269 family protein [Gemmatimonadaceae bacterium]|nr:DUF2269 family protein [Gemmatimonadaceae bacterium]